MVQELEKISIVWYVFFHVHQDTPVTANAIVSIVLPMARTIGGDKIQQLRRPQKAKKAGWLLLQTPAAAARKKPIFLPPEKYTITDCWYYDILGT